MAKLIAISGPDYPKEWEIETGISPAGRRPVNSIVLSDPSVSRQHFSIRMMDDQVSIINHSATQGTYVNGIKVDGELQLNHEDQIRVGETTLVFNTAEAAHESGFSTSDIRDNQPLPGLGGPPPDPSQATAAAAPEEESYEAVANPLEASIVGLAGMASDSSEGLEVQKRLRLINDIGQQLVAQLDLRELFSLILEKVFELIPVDSGHVLLFDPKKRRVETVAIRNADGSTAPTEHTPSKSLVLFAVRERKAVLSADTQADDRFSAQVSIISRGIKSAMCVPMLYQDETLGVIYVDNYESGYTFNRGDLDLLSILSNQAAVAVRNAKLLQQLLTEEAKRSNLSRYLSPQIVDTVSQENYNLELGGKKVQAAILESDIRGFTSLSEGMDPADVVSMLNTYFSEMTEIVFDTKGTLDKYIGDALLAAWGSPVPDAEASINALRAAVMMQGRLPEITFPQGGAFAIGIGLHYGDVLHGNLGSEKIMQYTVIGDTVNTAARLCDKCKAGKILMSDKFVESLGREVPLTELEPMQFKGKSEPMKVFEFAGTLDDLKSAD